MQFDILVIVAFAWNTFNLIGFERVEFIRNWEFVEICNFLLNKLSENVKNFQSEELEVRHWVLRVGDGLKYN